MSKKVSTTKSQDAAIVDTTTTERIVPAPVTNDTRTSRGLIALLIALGAIGLLAIIGLIIYFTQFYISKSDYTHAATQTNTVVSDYNKLSTAVDDYATAAESATTTDSQLAAKKSAYDATYSTYLNNAKSLSNERAMKNDKVKAAYNAFVAKNNAFTQNNDTMSATMATMHKVAVNCDESKVGQMDTNDLSKLVSAYDAAVRPCVNSMKELAQSKNSDAAQVGKKAVSYFDEMRTYIVNMQDAYNTQDRTKFDSEYNAFMAKADSFSSDTDIAAIQKHQDGLSPTAELNKLVALIEAQK